MNDRDEVEKLAATVQDATGKTVELIYVYQDYTGKRAENATKKTALNYTSLN